MNYVKDFQKKYGLYADGILGPNTANKMMSVWDLTPEQTAHVLGQGFVESKGFTQGRESMNYSVQGLQDTFNFYANDINAAIADGRNGLKPANQEAIANNVYADANRSEKYKLGNTKKGDGWKNRGVGLIQLTGRTNIEAFCKWMCLDPDIDRDVIERDFFWHTSIFYLGEMNHWRYCDSVDVYACKEVTKIVQGGTRHLKERTEATFKFYKMLK